MIYHAHSFLTHPTSYPKYLLHSLITPQNRHLINMFTHMRLRIKDCTYSHNRKVTKSTDDVWRLSSKERGKEHPYLILWSC